MRALGRAALGTAAAALIGPLEGCGGVPTYRGALVNGKLRVPIDTFETLAAGRDAIAVSVIDRAYPVLLLRARGEFRALSARCTHLGCHVKPASEFIVCPCHGSTYDLDGRVVRGPAPAPLDRYPVEVDASAVVVDLARREDA